MHVSGRSLFERGGWWGKHSTRTVAVSVVKLPRGGCCGAARVYSTCRHLVRSQRFVILITHYKYGCCMGGLL